MTTTTSSDWTKALPDTKDRAVMHAALHRSAPDSIIGRALEQVPAWVAARDALAALGPVQPEERAVWEGITSHVSGIVQAALDAGQPIGPDLYATVAQEETNLRGRWLTHQAVATLRRDRANDLDQALAAASADLLANLSTELVRVVARARELHARTGGYDFENAHRRGALTELEELRDLAGSYQSLRSAQHDVWTAVASDNRQLRNVTAAMIANPLKIDAEFVPRTLGVRVRDDQYDEREPIPAPWPANFAHADALDWFILHPAAQPWIPTTRQLAAAEDAILTAVDQGRLNLAYGSDRRRVYDARTTTPVA